MKRAGGCLCGALRYEAEAEPIYVAHCYCEDCRRESGSDHLTHVAVPDAALRISGALKVYEKPDARGTIRRLFCPECGTTIGGRPASQPGVTNIRTGTLDDVTGIAPQFAVFCARVRGWTVIDPDVKQFPEPPPDAQEP
ncbi:MAG: GFA family protein [Hyphomonadaceae bacterium]|nr:GFA family protein [Hyphomonadaceae bacterium]